jgi:hypothetical protein
LRGSPRWKMGHWQKCTREVAGQSFDFQCQRTQSTPDSTTEIVDIGNLDSVSLFVKRDR